MPEGLNSDLNLNVGAPPRVRPQMGEWGPLDVPPTRKKRRMRWWTILVLVGIVGGLGSIEGSLLGAIMVGLYRRERTGRGSQVGSSLIANGFWANSFNVQAALCDATFYPRPPREQLFNALTAYYRCRDGKWLILTILNEDRQWPVLARCLDREALLSDPRFARQADRFKHAQELIAELDAAFAARERAEWRQVLNAAGLVFEIVATAQDTAVDQQAVDAGVLVPFENDTLRTVDTPLFVDGVPKVVPRKAPHVGQHTDEILREAGYAGPEIEGLRASGAVA